MIDNVFVGEWTSIAIDSNDKVHIHIMKSLELLQMKRSMLQI